MNKYLAQCGVGSRRWADRLIRAGRVKVNGRVIQELGVKIDENKDQVQVDDQVVKPKRHFTYVLLNKPRGVITTVSDERKRKTVLDLIKSSERLFPVGRLDKDTTGLLLLTNDGELAYHLTHPKFKIEKIYLVRLNRPLNNEDRLKLARGVQLEEGKTAPCKIEYVHSKNRTEVKVILQQGWKRQIRRMFASLNYEVVELKRLGMANLTINGLKEGAWRYLNNQEIQQLKKYMGL